MNYANNPQQQEQQQEQRELNNSFLQISLSINSLCLDACGIELFAEAMRENRKKERGEREREERERERTRDGGLSVS